jgi:hypothetical protein
MDGRGSLVIYALPQDEMLPEALEDVFAHPARILTDLFWSCSLRDPISIVADEGVDVRCVLSGQQQVGYPDTGLWICIRPPDADRVCDEDELLSGIQPSQYLRVQIHFADTTVLAAESLCFGCKSCGLAAVKGP